MQILFWYNGVLQVLPSVKLSHSLFDAIFLNIRGLYVPKPIAEPRRWLLIALLIGIVGAIYSRAGQSGGRSDRTAVSQLSVGFALIVGLPLLVIVVLGSPITWNCRAAGIQFPGRHGT